MRQRGHLRARKLFPPPLANVSFLLMTIFQKEPEAEAIWENKTRSASEILVRISSEGEDIGAITYIVIVDLSGKKWGSKWEIIL